MRLPDASPVEADDSDAIVRARNRKAGAPLDKTTEVPQYQLMDRPPGYDWDDAKAATNLANHRISFTTAIEVFADSEVIVTSTTRLRDGEERQKAVGRIGDRLFTVVFTMRSTNRRLISARRANAKEERAYGTPLA